MQTSSSTICLQLIANDRKLWEQQEVKIIQEEKREKNSVNNNSCRWLAFSQESIVLNFC